MGEDRNGLKREIKELIIEAVNLTDVHPDQLDDGAPLFGSEPLDLDSIDALEIIVALQKTYGVHLDSQNLAVEILQSIDSIAEFVESHRQAGSP